MKSVNIRIGTDYDFIPAEIIYIKIRKALVRLGLDLDSAA